MTAPRPPGPGEPFRAPPRGDGYPPAGPTAPGQQGWPGQSWPPGYVPPPTWPPPPAQFGQPPPAYPPAGQPIGQPHGQTGQPFGQQPYGSWPGYPPPRRPRSLLRRLTVTVLATATMAAGVGLAAVAARKLGHTGSSYAEQSAQWAKDVQAVDDVRARALQRRDEKTFLSYVDPARKTLVATERRVFRSFSQLPYDYLHYQPSTGYQSDDMAGAWKFNTLLLYRIKGVDRAPVDQFYVHYWIRKGGRLLLAKVEQVRRKKTVTDDSPLDLPNLVVRNGPLVTVVAPASVTNVGTIAVAADRAARRVLRVWRGQPSPRRFILFVATSTAQARQWSGEADSDVLGFTVPVIASSESGASSRPAYAGARVVLDRQAMSTSRTGTTEVLQHEFTHAVGVFVQKPPASFSSDRGYPIWVEEGFASYVEEIDEPTSAMNRLPGIRYVIRTQGWNRALPPSDRFLFYGANLRTTSFNYGMATLVYRYLAERYGQARAVQFYVQVASRKDGSVAGTIQAMFGQDVSTFQRGWLGYVDQVVG